MIQTDQQCTAMTRWIIQFPIATSRSQEVTFTRRHAMLAHNWPAAMIHYIILTHRMYTWNKHKTKQKAVNNVPMSDYAPSDENALQEWIWVFKRNVDKIVRSKCGQVRQTRIGLPSTRACTAQIFPTQRTTLTKFRFVVILSFSPLLTKS